MNGILVVDKPAGFTSFDVVAKLRGICATRRIGHGGTLDPMATGVLPVFVGMAAKAVDLQPRQDKVYEATLLLGTATDTGDVTGEVLRTASVQVGEAELLAALPGFAGEQMQVPPMYSAVKVNGKALYRYAREGVEVQRKARPVTIHSIEYLGQAGQHQYRLQVHCSKGTYIRTLVEDIGEALGLPATLAALRRTAAGGFSLEDAHSLEELQAAKDAGTLKGLLLGVETVFGSLPRLQVNEEASRRLANGAPVYGVKAENGRYAAYAPGGFLGLVQVLQDGMMRAEKLFLPE